MISANKALEIYLGAVDVSEHMNYLEESIIARSRDKLRWFSFDYGFLYDEGKLCPDTKVEIIHQLRDAGYDVEDEWGHKRLIIRW